MNVTYTKAMRERAKVEKKFLVTIAIDGKHMKDAACCVQALIDLPKAKEIMGIAVELLKKRR